jgi:hypothetical protein
MFPDLTEFFNNPNQSTHPRKSIDWNAARRSIDLGPRRSIDLGASRKSIDLGRRKSSFALYQPFTPSMEPNFNFENAELDSFDDKRQNLPPGQRRHSSITAYLLAYDMLNNANPGQPQMQSQIQPPMGVVPPQEGNSSQPVPSMPITAAHAPSRPDENQSPDNSDDVRNVHNFSY